MAEGSRLLSGCPANNGTSGSNPDLSARRSENPRGPPGPLTGPNFLFSKTGVDRAEGYVLVF